MIAGVLLIFIVTAVAGLVLATVGLPGAKQAVGGNETALNSSNQTETGKSNAETLDPASVEVSDQVPQDVHTSVVWTNETDAGLAANHEARMTGLNNHAALMAADFADAGFNVSESDGELYSTRFTGIEEDSAYANFSTVTVTIKDDTETFHDALDLAARTLRGATRNGSPPATYTNESGEALQPDYVQVVYQLEDGTTIVRMTTPIEVLRAAEQGEITPDEYARRTVGTSQSKIRKSS